MSYREVTMFEIKEVLRLRIRGKGNKTIGRELGLDPKTVRSYVRLAEKHGLKAEAGEASLTDALIAGVVSELRTGSGRPHGETWALCEEYRSFIESKLISGVKLIKALRLLKRERGVELPYATAHRFAVQEFDFGRLAPTVPVLDCDPGQEVQVDTGWVLKLEGDPGGKARKLRAWIFTAVRSRHRFAYPVERETTESAIVACEAAWEFFGGVFHVLIVDNTKAIVEKADPIHPRIVKTFLEYAQARGFEIDTARVKTPTDKARVERAVQTVRDDCFGGERIVDIEQARSRAVAWSLHEYGVRLHTRTGRRPREHFEAEERAALLPLPTEPYDVPKWCEPKVARDHYAQVGKALYSLPRHFIGRRLLARADKKLVRFYEGATVVKVHPRMKPGQRSTDDSDFPPEKSAAAKRDAEFFIRQAAEHGRVIGDFARALLQGPAPWTRMRRIYKLLGFVKRFGADPVSRACEIALASDMFDLYRLERMIERNTAARLAAASIPTATLPPLPARYLRPPEQFALSLPGMGSGNGLIQLQGGRSYDHNDNPKSDSLRTQDGAQTAQALAAS